MKFPYTIPTAIFLTLAGSTSVLAQDETISAPAADTAELDRAARLLSIMVGAFQSEEIPDEAKTALFGCLYQNTLKAISAETTNVIEANEQLSADEPSHVLSAATRICGYDPDVAQDSEALGR